MQDLKVIGVENGALLAANEDGERFRIAIDEVLQSHVKQGKPDPADSVKVSPREIQAHIRQGLSAEDVAEITGASLDYIQRFEGPIIAEREHIVSAALGVAVQTKEDVDPLGEPATFGDAIRERLGALGASGERWASWKDEEAGWIVKLSFTADSIDHDARWRYDQRKNSLAAANSEAVALSQQGELRGSLIPRLRAVTTGTSQDESRFDSGAFTFIDELESASDGAPRLEPVAPARMSANNSIAITAIKRSDDGDAKASNQTADLLEALRKRRGEREVPAAQTAEPEPPRSTAVPLDNVELEPAHRQSPQRSSGDQGTNPSGQQPTIGNPNGPRGKKGRAAMPSWDEIVFGARKDDDPPLSGA